MSEIRKDSAGFIGYEYKEIDVRGERTAMYLDCYPHFGWQIDEREQAANGAVQKTITLKRDRKIVNKMELTRLQRHFEACMGELDQLEQSKTTSATIGALMTGLIGTAFMAGSTFAAVHKPPLLLLSILLAVPGFMGWIVPCFLYRYLKGKRTKIVAELMEQKYDEIYALCEKGSSLLL